MLLRYLSPILLTITVATTVSANSLYHVSVRTDDSGLTLRMFGELDSNIQSQFYIDIDDDKNTGDNDSDTKGADYLVENDYVLKYVNGAWDEDNLVYIDTYKNDERVKAVVPYSAVGITEDGTREIRLKAAVMDEEWNHYKAYPLKEKMRRVSIISTIKEEVKPLTSLTVDSNHDSLILKMFGDIKNYPNTQFYIDIDNDKNTGDSDDDTKGADYLIENDYILKYVDGEWDNEHPVYIDIEKDDKHLETTVTYSLLGLTKLEKDIQVLAAVMDEEWNHYQSYPSQMKGFNVGEKSLVINEVMAENAHTIVDPDFLQFSDWIELHNQTSNAIDISNYTLSDKLDKQKWTIPSGTVIGAGEYMMFWADGKDKVSKGFHTNFTLKGKGEAVALFDVHQNLVDGFSFGKQKPDVSAILIDGKVRYMTPTPNTKNNHAVEELILSDKPTFSVTGSFHEDAQRIELRAESGSTIYYTLDGSFPTENSSVYTGAIDIGSTKIVRARAKEAGKLLSYATTKSYFIGQETALDIISISTDDKYLFDNTMGIYTIGTNGAKTPGCSDGPSIANFYQGWKRPANLEYFKNSNKELEFSQEFDIKISGSCSRMLPQKSLSISAKKKYEKDVLEYKLFPNKDIQKVKGFKLKSAGQDWYKAMLRDAFAHQVIKDDFDVEYQDYKPVVVFLNGEYWGIHNIREKKNEDFLAANHSGVDDKKVDILKNNMSINEGSKENYEDMITYIKTHELSDNDNYNEVKTMMDVENYMDYIIAETYFGNDDWPYENVRYWREKDASPKWRWILEDLDLGLNIYEDEEGITNMFNLITATSNVSDRNPLWSTFLFRKLIKNDNFKSRFKEKYEGYLDSTFETSRVKGILDSMAGAIRGEIPRHTAKWGSGDVHTPRNKDRWEENISFLKDVIDDRTDTVRDQLNDWF